MTCEEYKHHPHDLAIVHKYVDYMRVKERYREALSAILELPLDVRNSQPARAILSDTYRDMGWHAHAIMAYENSEMPNRAHRKGHDSWWRRRGPLGSRRTRQFSFERRVESIWNEWSANTLGAFDKLNLPQRIDVAQVRAQVDAYLLQRATMRVRRTASIRWMASDLVRLTVPGAMWISVVAAIYLVWPATPFSDILIAGILFIFFGALVSLDASLFTDPPDTGHGHIWFERRINAERAGYFTAILLGVVLLYAGRAWTWPPVIGLVLVISAVFWFASSWPIYRFDRSMWKIRPQKARQVLIADLLYLLSEISDPSRRNNLQARARWLAFLEDIAYMLERNLPSYVHSHDQGSRTEIADWASGAAADLREKEFNIAVPDEDSWARLSSELTHMATAVILGDFHALEVTPRSSGIPVYRRGWHALGAMPDVWFICAALATIIVLVALHAAPDTTRQVAGGLAAFVLIAIEVRTRLNRR